MSYLHNFPLRITPGALIDLTSSDCFTWPVDVTQHNQQPYLGHLL